MRAKQMTLPPLALARFAAAALSLLLAGSSLAAEEAPYGLNREKLKPFLPQGALDGVCAKLPRARSYSSPAKLAVAIMELDSASGNLNNYADIDCIGKVYSKEAIVKYGLEGDRVAVYTLAMMKISSGDDVCSEKVISDIRSLSDADSLIYGMQIMRRGVRFPDPAWVNAKISAHCKQYKAAADAFRKAMYGGYPDAFFLYEYYLGKFGAEADAIAAPVAFPAGQPVPASSENTSGHVAAWEVASALDCRAKKLRICKGDEGACEVKTSVAALTVDFKANTVRVLGGGPAEPIAVRLYKDLQNTDDMHYVSDIHYIALGSGPRVITFGRPVRDTPQWTIEAMFTDVHGSDVYTELMTCEGREP